MFNSISPLKQIYFRSYCNVYDYIPTQKQFAFFLTSVFCCFDKRRNHCIVAFLHNCVLNITFQLFVIRSIYAVDQIYFITFLLSNFQHSKQSLLCTCGIDNLFLSKMSSSSLLNSCLLYAITATEFVTAEGNNCPDAS